uniref:Transketolase n=1 Tax=Desulfovibrio sp. U5L TaxID=596152 RepID=I2PXV0_9BACT
MDLDALQAICRRIRHDILTATTEAGSGHPTSSLSGVELMAGLLFGGLFRFDADRPDRPDNDRLIFSKGHASPLFYALWAAAGKISRAELMTLRKFGSPLEGHPVAGTPFAEAATGSLGQGLSIGVGMAMNAKFLDKLPYRTYVLLGDSEMAEGSVWEALEIGAHYALDNLVAILDVNRLGQRGETLYGHDLGVYDRKLSAFGWNTILLDGHDQKQVLAAYAAAEACKGRPTAIIARTIKGKGVSFIEDKNGWHGKPLPKEDLPRALAEIGEADLDMTLPLAPPPGLSAQAGAAFAVPPPDYDPKKSYATRKAYGDALARLAPGHPDMVVLDGEVSNSTYAEDMKKVAPDRFFEMYVAEQNMAGVGLGLSRRGKKPLCSTFAAFWSRAFDQIRMAQYSAGNVVYCGSHAGVSIGEDGPSQMGLEDLAMFRTISGSAVLYPGDAMSCERLVEEAVLRTGITYIRTTRAATPILYGPEETFPVGGSKVVRSSGADKVLVVAAGITLTEALAAADSLAGEGTAIRVLDAYSVKPLDEKGILAAAETVAAVVVVEDHYPEGGLGEAVAAAFAGTAKKVVRLSVEKMPKSGKPQELLDFEGISRAGIVKTVKTLL